MFFFNDTATTEIYTLSLHDALPISGSHLDGGRGAAAAHPGVWADGIPAAVGQSRLLGDRGSHADCRAGAGARAVPDAPAGRRRRRWSGDLRALLWIARAAAPSGHSFPDRGTHLPGTQARRGAGAG